MGVLAAAIRFHYIPPPIRQYRNIAGSFPSWHANHCSLSVDLGQNTNELSYEASIEYKHRRSTTAK